MSTDPMFKCSRCKKYKPSDEYGTRQRGGIHSQKGDRLAVCLTCSAASSAHQKRRRIESDSDRPAKRFAAEPPALLSQFVEALAKHASTPKINDSWRVSLDEITLADKGIADHIASLVWKATGYRFSFYSLKTTGNGLYKRFIYQCCQARGTSNDRAKQTTADKENQRIVRRMERFDCHGRLHIALRDGVAVVKITHQQSHKSYDHTREVLPENEREAAPSPAALVPQYWSRQDSAPSQHSLPLTASQNLVSSPQKGHSTGTDGLLYESEPDGFTEPLSFDEQCDIMEQQLLSVLALFRSKRAHMDPHWYAAFRDSAKDLFKFVKDHIRDEARRTLPKK